MRLTWMGTVAALGALACGGEQQAQQTQAAQQSAAAGGPAGAVVEVKMTGNGTTTAAFEPATLTVAPGTTVRFVNVSGGPHNVAFWADSIPAGAAPKLNAAMPNRMDNLSGPFVTNPNEAYDIAFGADAVKGAYRAYCLPHLALGMSMTITVR